MQKVQIYLMISGDYCAFHEIDFTVAYDVTNNIKLLEETIDDLQNWDFHKNGGGYSDVQLTDAYLIDGKYYYNI